MYKHSLNIVKRIKDKGLLYIKFCNLVIFFRTFYLSEQQNRL